MLTMRWHTKELAYQYQQDGVLRKQVRFQKPFSLYGIMSFNGDNKKK